MADVISKKIKLNEIICISTKCRLRLPHYGKGGYKLHG